MTKEPDDAPARTLGATEDGEPPLARVTVYGAGVTGLTVAHELAERGFRVRVVAPARPPAAREDRDEDAPSIGGDARTQYTRAGRRRAGLHDGPEEALLPGERRSSFFPAYFRHVFDTMRRTPLYDDLGAKTGRTVLDNVVALDPRDELAPRLHNPLVSPERARGGGLAMARALARLIDDGYDWRDLQQFFLRIFRYLATSPARRAAELERLSWWEYLCGDDPVRGARRYRYSARFARDMKRGPPPLAAFDVEWGDARTCGSTYAQLLLRGLSPGDAVEGALNGPASEAWFAPWRRHLERLGVEFVRGRLETVRLDAGGRPRPYVSLGACTEERRAPRADEPSDYYVIATDVLTAEQVSRELPEIGVPGQLRGYTTRVPARPRADAGAAREPDGARRDPCAQPGLAPWDRLQTRAGVQFFFARDAELPRGRLHLARSAWALRSTDTSRRWRRPPTPREDGYAAALSVDVGAWDQPSDDPALAGRSAWQVSRGELAAEVWRQLEDALADASADALNGDEDAAEAPRTLPQPTWFHIDENIVYRRVDPLRAGADDALPIEDAAPLLIPIADDWRRRPGADPSDMSTKTYKTPRREPGDPAIWAAPRGGCWIHWGALVYAGTYKRTFTRLTTAESANESARHAVNAILDHLASSRVDAERPPPPVADDRAHLDSNTRRWRPSAPDRARPRRCRTWNIEDHELPEFSSLREQDAQLLQLGLPHPWDLAGVETLPTLMSRVPSTRAPDFTELRRLLEALLLNANASASARTNTRDPGENPRENPRHGPTSATPDLRASLEALHNIRLAVERELSRLFHQPDEP